MQQFRAVTCPEAFTGTKWCQLVPTALMKAFLSILHICSDTVVVLMQQQQLYTLPFALLCNASPHYRRLRDRFIFLLMHLRTAGKHLRLFKNTACGRNHHVVL